MDIFLHSSIFSLSFIFVFAKWNHTILNLHANQNTGYGTQIVYVDGSSLEYNGGLFHTTPAMYSTVHGFV